MVQELQSNLQDLYSRLPSVDEIINHHFSDKYMDALINKKVTELGKELNYLMNLIL